MSPSTAFLGTYMPLYRCAMCNAILAEYFARFGVAGVCGEDCAEKMRKQAGAETEDAQ